MTSSPFPDGGLEMRGWRSRGVPVTARDVAGRIRLARVRLRPIDVR